MEWKCISAKEARIADEEIHRRRQQFTRIVSSEQHVAALVERGSWWIELRQSLHCFPMGSRNQPRYLEPIGYSHTLSLVKSSAVSQKGRGAADRWEHLGP